jgi:hypothetical protein
MKVMKAMGSRRQKSEDMQIALPGELGMELTVDDGSPSIPRSISSGVPPTFARRAVSLQVASDMESRNANADEQCVEKLARTTAYS